jgi:tRNA-modifying protein YgfZ
VSTENTIAVARVALDGVTCVGPDAATFLQGQVSQDIEALALGDSAEALLLSPQGRLEAHVRVLRTASDAFVLLADAGAGELVRERLRRFKIRIKAELDETPYGALVLFSEFPGAAQDSAKALIAGPLAGASVTTLYWPGRAAIAVIAEGAPPDPTTFDELDGAVPLGDADFDRFRVEAGIPRWGAELDDRTIAEEAGLVERTVSFTKGCYTGQELVARLDARGNNVARRLRLVRVAGDGPTPAVGDVLVEDGTEIGSLTSVAAEPNGGYVALGFFRRAVLPPATVTLSGSSGPYSAALDELPAV